MKEEKNTAGTIRSYVERVMDYDTILRRESLNYFLSPLVCNGNTVQDVTYEVERAPFGATEESQGNYNNILMRDALLLTGVKQGDKVQVFYSFTERFCRDDMAFMLGLLMGMTSDNKAGDGTSITQVAVSTRSNFVDSMLTYDALKRGLVKGSLHYTIPVIRPCVSACNTLLGPIFWYERMCAMEGSSEMTANLIYHYKRSLESITTKLEGHPEQNEIAVDLYHTIAQRYGIKTLREDHNV